MKKKINVFDIELDAFSAKEAMKQIIQYLESETISLVEVVTLEMLMQGQNNPQWKEQMQKMDLVIPCEKEILEVSGICDKTVIKDLENKTLLKMFFKYLQKDKKKIFSSGGGERTGRGRIIYTTRDAVGTFLSRTSSDSR